MTRDSPRRELQHRHSDSHSRQKHRDSNKRSHRDRSPRRRSPRSPSPPLIQIKREKESPSRHRSRSSRNESHRDRSPRRRSPRPSSSFHSHIKQERHSPSGSRPRHSHQNFPRNRSPRRKGPQSSFLRDTQTERTKEHWGKKEDPSNPNEDSKPIEKEKPNFGLSGKLVEDTNKINGVVIKYAEPEDAKKPTKKWRLYQFKEDKELPVLHVHRVSAYLMGRDRRIADIPLDHPSCSMQHSALQYRLVPLDKNSGRKVVRPYLIDLESSNGTYINGSRIEPRKYYQLFEKDVIKFGYSSREYVLLHDQSDNNE